MKRSTWESMFDNPPSDLTAVCVVHAVVKFLQSICILSDWAKELSIFVFPIIHIILRSFDYTVIWRKNLGCSILLSYFRRREVNG
jgi:hypothetical protein